ncbi:putative phosphotransacetylase [Natronincola peptidivorans]|uniref:Phosphate propanoyltransferase n=1 Tax=Natronincola peptidivorans TaxID=426128 RepID=A0A1I0CF89_9FIRM|nr:phosphate propanoyltransferase [Natronincola peptidivorans]SET18231.1 putative phosphotransacetylase [Natronincola peptidivorans]
MEEKIIDLITKTVMKELSSKESGGIPIGVSARHIHISRKDLDTLFGEDYQLKKKKELMGGQFASAEMVTIVGTKLKAIENVRILGPIRSKTQVEVARTDAIKLGINPPVRESGDLKASAPIAIVGPKGVVYLEEGCIIANRHIHMSPKDAFRFGVRDQEIVTVEIVGKRGGTFDDVQVRVDESFTLEMHLDTDEANGMGIISGDHVVLKKKMKA